MELNPAFSDIVWNADTRRTEFVNGNAVGALPLSEARIREAREARGFLAVACPYCKAKVGVPCRTKSGSVTAEPHTARESPGRALLEWIGSCRGTTTMNRCPSRAGG